MGLESPMAMQKLHVSLSIWGKLFTDVLIHINTPAAFPLLDKRAKLKRNRSHLQKRMPLTVLSQAEVDPTEILMKTFAKQDANASELQLIFPEL